MEAHHKVEAYLDRAQPERRARGHRPRLGDAAPLSARDTGGMEPGPEDTVAFRLWPPVAIGAPLLVGGLATRALG